MIKLIILIFIFLNIISFNYGFELKMYIYNNSKCDNTDDNGVVSVFSVSQCSDYGLIELVKNGDGGVSNINGGYTGGMVYDPIENITDCYYPDPNKPPTLKRVIEIFQFNHCNKKSDKVSYLYEYIETKQQTVLPKQVTVPLPPQKMEHYQCSSISFFYNDAHRLEPNCNYTKIRSYKNGTCYLNPWTNKYDNLFCIGDNIITYDCGYDSQCTPTSCFYLGQFPSNSTIYDEKCVGNITFDDQEIDGSNHSYYPNNSFKQYPSLFILTLTIILFISTFI